MTVTEKKNDVVSIAPSERELSGLSKALIALMRIRDLAQSGGFPAFRIVFVPPTVEPSDGFDQSRLTLGRLDQLLS
jgi:hypothetical protein